MVFVQKSFLDNFKGRISTGFFISGPGTFTVDDSFQYGQQDSSGTGRWLVFHDKGQKPYQVSYWQECEQGMMQERGLMF